MHRRFYSSRFTHTPQTPPMRATEREKGRLHFTSHQVQREKLETLRGRFPPGISPMYSSPDHGVYDLRKTPTSEPMVATPSGFLWQADPETSESYHEAPLLRKSWQILQRFAQVDQQYSKCLPSNRFARGLLKEKRSDVFPSSLGYQEMADASRACVGKNRRRKKSLAGRAAQLSRGPREPNTRSLKRCPSFRRHSRPRVKRSPSLGSQAGGRARVPGVT